MFVSVEQVGQGYLVDVFGPVAGAHRTTGPGGAEHRCSTHRVGIDAANSSLLHSHTA
jgi:hypothetical protein